MIPPTTSSMMPCPTAGIAGADHEKTRHVVQERIGAAIHRPRALRHHRSGGAARPGTRRRKPTVAYAQGLLSSFPAIRFPTPVGQGVEAVEDGVIAPKRPHRSRAWKDNNESFLNVYKSLVATKAVSSIHVLQRSNVVWTIRRCSNAIP